MIDRTLKAFSVLLAYPGPETQAAMVAVRAQLDADARLSGATLAALSPLIDRLEREDLVTLQEAYVTLFDRTRALSLNLFEHVHGESRDRGGAMVSLLESYRAAGFEPATSELPDHLPVLLEYLATCPGAEMRETLQDAAHILAALAGRLERRDTPYAAALRALLVLAAARPDHEAVDGILSRADDDPGDLAALDAAWEESEVTFGPDPSAGCPQVRGMLARMDDAPDTPRRAPAR